jgi:transglutaminase-like putative cysteine protease
VATGVVVTAAAALPSAPAPGADPRSARSLARADDRVLHEFVPEPGAEEGSDLVARAGDPEPAGIVVDGEVVPPPSDVGLGPDERAMRPAPGDGARQEVPGRRSTTFRPDLDTQLEGQLHYFEVFAPAIAPYKRVTALDAVTLGPDGVTPVLTVASTRRVAVPVEGTGVVAGDARPRDKFWGSVVLEMEGSDTVPLPSVSPESRILTLRAEPAVHLRVERDSADNFFAVTPTPMRGQIRLTFLTDAPRAYFGRALPAGAVDARAAEVPPLPPSVQARGLRFAAELGLRRGMPWAAALEALVAHFRAFEEAPSPPRLSGDVYLDLARGKKGVCRHRAYAFVVTAQALGMPSRFLQNEAHAWVEVKLPGQGVDGGWLRIDLGGAATGLQAHAADDAPLYRPDVPDPLPRPEAYERSYSQLREASGLRAGAGGAAGPRSATGPSSGRATTLPGGSAQRDGTGGGAAPGSGASGSGRAPGMGAASAAAAPGAVGSAGAATTGAPGGGRLPLQVAVHTFYREVFRGRELQVTGRVTDASGNGVAGQRVEVSLQTPGGDRAVLLGVTVSREGGAFRGSFGVPPDAGVGAYRLLVVAPGDARYAPAMAR